MKNQKKFFIAGVIMMIAALFSGCGPHLCSKERGWGHHGFKDKDFPERIMKRLDRKVDDLDLSESQSETYKEIRAKIKANLIKAGEERGELFDEIRAQLDREKPDMNAAVELVKEKLRGMPEHMGHTLDLFMEFYNVLDEDQKAKVVEMIRKRARR
jgi:hypothetical protein